MMLEIELGGFDSWIERPDSRRIPQCSNRPRSVISPIMEEDAGTAMKLIASLAAVSLVLSANTTQGPGADYWCIRCF